MATIAQTCQCLHNLSISRIFLHRLPIIFSLKTVSRRNFSITADYHSNVLSEHRMNPNIRKMEYAVRGVIPMRAKEIAKEIEKVHT